ncbi:MAG: DUF4421 family protein [Flavobacteriaceae bacterium]
MVLRIDKLTKITGLIVFCFLFKSAGLLGQKRWEKDSTYITSYADKFVLKLNVDTQTSSYELRDLSGRELNLEHNNTYRLYVSLDYQFFGLSFGIAPDIFGGEDNLNLKGESSMTDFRFRAALGNWVQGFQFSTLKGFYVDNTGDFVPDWMEGIDPYIQIPDFTNRIYGMSTHYVLNPNFSFRNILYNTEWQKKSAGSWIPSLFYGWEDFEYTFEGVKSDENIFQLKLALPYYHTWVLNENWFVGVNISPSLGVSFSRYKEDVADMRIEESRTYLTRGIEGGIQIGYAAERWVFGSSFVFDVNGYDEERLGSVENNKFFAQVYVGYRLNTPGFIDRGYNKAARKIGLQ